MFISGIVLLLILFVSWFFESYFAEVMFFMDYDAPDFEDVIESDKWKMKSKSFRVFLSFRY